ncbi:MAG: DNA/RNA non-specific endonuclease [Pseudolabrys sp.]
MAQPHEKLARLRRYNASVQQNDPKLAEESRDTGAELEAFTAAPSPEAVEKQIELESIVMRRQRPVLAIRDNVTKLIFIDEADSEIWGERLKKARPLLDRAIPAVGRIDLTGARLDWVGTGWLVAENIIVTNRHVANEFAARSEGFAFKMGLNGQISADVDFLQEIDNSKRLVFKLLKPLHIEEPPGPDVAFFEIEIVSGNAKLAEPIDLATMIVNTENVATIGYPAYDSRIPEPDLMERIYGKIYNKKRLAPGGVTQIESTRLCHNCTTLGGNSGSVVFDLTNGQAVGLHFSGSFLATNYAVRADVVKKLLDDIHSGRRRRQPGGVSLTFPADGGETDLIDETESVASDYRDRGGYDPEFLGSRFVVDLPTVTRHADDVLDFEFDGETQTELRYEHFSVVMSRSRRMCFLSGCNIDGNLSKKSPRARWKGDPRIPKSQQIMKECYGAPPKFSRGHMTRREDPGWGTRAVAKRGNEDTMHVTNVAPQMQAFNAPIWLALEDYALQHAREDEMKISVFTGPYFTDRDPDMYGVLIPLTYWKVIAFIHDDTGKLCATGYEMSQEQSLQPEEFVYGVFTSPQLGTATQVPIRSIEAKSGIHFGKLASVDPLAGDEEGVSDAGPRTPLLALEQIRFVR